MEVGEKITRESRNGLQILVRDVNNAAFRLKQAVVNSVLGEFVEPIFLFYSFQWQDVQF